MRISFNLPFYFKLLVLFNYLVLGYFVFMMGCDYSENCHREYGQCNYPVRNSLNNSSENSESVNNGAIYLDLSRSMQGYISDVNFDIPFTMLQHLLQRGLQTAFHHVEISMITFWGFNKNIIKDVAPMAYYAIKSRDGIPPRSRFTSAETNIIGVLLESAKNPSSLSIIITDGLQDVHNINGELAFGYDRPEFVNAITDSIIEKGFGIWLIGIMNDFDGVYYNIIPDEHGIINKRIRVEKTKRPIYFWIICKDIKKGREFVQYIVEEFLIGLADRYQKDDNLINAIEIAPGIIPNLSLTESINNKTSKNMARIRFWSDNPELPTTYNICADFPAAIADTVKLSLTNHIEYPVLGFRWNSLPLSLWQIDIHNPSRYPLFASYDTQNMIDFRFPYNRLIVFEHDQRLIELPFYLYADLDKGLENHWIRKWNTNTDTNRKSIEGKTLYLFDVVKALLNHTIGKKQLRACIHLSLIKRDG